jgi:hypothetical protein
MIGPIEWYYDLVSERSSIERTWCIVCNLWGVNIKLRRV